MDQAVDFRPVYTRQHAPAILQTHDEAIARARALQPNLRERALETEQLRRLHTRRLKRFGDYTLSLNPPEPFDTELVMPFALDDPPASEVVA